MSPSEEYHNKRRQLEDMMCAAKAAIERRDAIKARYWITGAQLLLGSLLRDRRTMRELGDA